MPHRLVLLFVALLCAALWCADTAPKSLDFSEADHGWKIRTPGVAALAAPERRDGAAELPVALPASVEYVTVTPEATLGLSSASRLVFRLKLPAALPQGTVLVVFSKDDDFLWRQMRVPVATLPEDAAGETTLTIPVAGQAAVDAWEPSGHGRPWTGRTASSLLEFGFRFELDGGRKDACAATAQLLSMQIFPVGVDVVDAIREFRVDTLKPQVGKRIEASFKLDGWVRTPYDSAKFSVKADVTLPDGKRETVRGYSMEDFLYDETDFEKVRCLTPSGEPQVRVRYCPRTAGPHKMAITVTAGGKTLALPEFAFEATAADAGYHGFVHVDPKDTQSFCHDDGTVFQGLGMNVRSPFDDRYFHVAPYSGWGNQGLHAYAGLFRKYREVGIDVAEVWMCSWWLALEWMNDAPGFHGVGSYNQYRAWMLDYIMHLAEENGIRVILVLNNHGKFGMTYDTEWARNPYNKARGGYLDRCEEYFRNDRAKADFKKTCDYIVARWGASPNLLAWKLFTEVDLTGQSIDAYKTDPNIPAWHAEMGAYLKSIDIYRHPVTTHWMLGYGRIDAPTASVKELDFLSTDAYYSLGSGTRGMMSLVTGGKEFGKQFGKPLVITEFGGSSYADSMRNMMNQVEVGLWIGYFHNMGISPMFWWFGLVEDKNLYGKYAAIKRFMAGEDRRGMAYCQRSANVGGQAVYELRGGKKLMFWVMDNPFFFAADENMAPPRRSGVKITAPALKGFAVANVEFWNTDTGAIIANTEIPVKDGKLELVLPDYQRSIAVKVTGK